MTLGQNASEFAIGHEFRSGNRVHQFAIVGWRRWPRIQRPRVREDGHQAFKPMRPGSQIGTPRLAVLMKHDPVGNTSSTSGSAKLALVLNFERTLHGYLDRAGSTPIFLQEFMEEWIIDQYLRTRDDFGLKNPGIGTFSGRTRYLPSPESMPAPIPIARLSAVRFVVPSPPSVSGYARKYPNIGTIGGSWEQVG